MILSGLCTWVAALPVARRATQPSAHCREEGVRSRRLPILYTTFCVTARVGRHASLVTLPSAVLGVAAATPRFTSADRELESSFLAKQFRVSNVFLPEEHAASHPAPLSFDYY
jgi:hypothetical protein